MTALTIQSLFEDIGMRLLHANAFSTIFRGDYTEEEFYAAIRALATYFVVDAEFPNVDHLDNHQLIGRVSQMAWTIKQCDKG